MSADVVVVGPAPGDVEEDITERARAAYRGTQRGRFTLTDMLNGTVPPEHQPFPLVRRVRG